MRRARRGGIGEGAALEDAGGEDRDAEGLAEREEVVGSGLVEQRVAPGQQNAVRAFVPLSRG